jgi:hypothetical protein
MTPGERAEVPIPHPSLVLPELHRGLRTAGGAKPLTLLQRNEAKNFALQVVRDPLYRERLMKRAQMGVLAPAVEQLLWHYAYGKPADRVEISRGPDLSDLTEEELADRAALLAQVCTSIARSKTPSEDPAA